MKSLLLRRSLAAMLLVAMPATAMAQSSAEVDKAVKDAFSKYKSL
jgi:hypothetical protein